MNEILQACADICERCQVANESAGVAYNDILTLGRKLEEARKERRQSEFKDTVKLANQVLDRPHADPDDDLATLARQFLRQVEKVKNLTTKPRLFPIQQGNAVPWVMAEKAYLTYARCFGSGQSLLCLAERGGFGVQEFSCLYAGHDPYECPDKQRCLDAVDPVQLRIGTLEKAVADLKENLVAALDPTLDLIHANRDEILRKHEEAVGLIRKALDVPPSLKLSVNHDRLSTARHRVSEVLDALALFHPMHDDWPGWPKE